MILQVIQSFRFEIREALDLGDNAVCYIDDISIPHTWHTIENYNNQLYIETVNNSVANTSIIILPNGNYTASSLAIALTLTLQARFPDISFSCNYNSNVGTIKITNFSYSQFRILTYETGVSLQNNNWYGDDGEQHHVYSLNINSSRSINEVFRNSVQSPSATSFESGFIDLLNVQYTYIYSFPESGEL